MRKRFTKREETAEDKKWHFLIRFDRLWDTSMHPCNYSKPAEANSTGKFAKAPIVGVHRIDNHGYKLHRYEISSRQVGMTVKRTTFSVTILGEAGERLIFLTDLPNSHAAQKAAEAWIDRTIRLRPKLQRLLRRKHLPNLPVPEVKQIVTSRKDAPRDEQ